MRGFINIKFKVAVIALLGLFSLTLWFQNCSNVQGQRTGTINFWKQNGGGYSGNNGGGYAGLQVDGPPSVKAGDSVLYTIMGGEPPYRYFVLQGSGTLSPLNDNQVLYHSDAGDQGQQIIRIKDSQENVLDLEIEVINLVVGDFKEDDGFGTAVSLFGETLAVGSPYDDDMGTQSGALYVFKREGNRWSRKQKISIAGGPYSVLGKSVSMDDRHMIVGSPNKGQSIDGKNISLTGRALIYQKVGSEFKLLTALEPEDLASGDEFGFEVAISGDQAFVGTRITGGGAVYVYERSGSEWNLKQKILPPVENVTWFGHKLVLNGDMLLVGSHSDQHPAYIFGYRKNPDGHWELFDHQAQRGAPYAGFGDVIAASGNLIYTSELMPTAQRGIHLYKVSQGKMNYVKTYLFPISEYGKGFGTRMAANDNYLIVGSPDQTVGDAIEAGVAYVFKRDNGELDLRRKLKGDRVIQRNRFGTGIAIQGRYGVVTGLRTGSVVVIRLK